jgi:N-dimethylarginine dimethylaminohydrolase
MRGNQGGAGWMAREAAFVEDMPDVWGDWGVSSEYGKLHSVLLRRPGSEVENVADYNAALWIEPMDGELAQYQHDTMVAAYRANGVTVHYVENGRLDKPNAHFVRDLMLMTPEGAIVARPAARKRAGEERFVAEALGRLGVPILMTVHGEGTFEGADVALAGPDLAFLAVGLRTNKAGADQVEWALRQVGYKDVVRLELPYGTVHLDGVLSLLDRDLAMVRFRETPLKAVQVLREHGFRIVDCPPEDVNMPGNIVPLAPGHLLAPAGNPHTKALLEDAGCTLIEVELREIQKSGGSIHCMTGFLKRDDP